MCYIRLKLLHSVLPLSFGCIVPKKSLNFHLFSQIHPMFPPYSHLFKTHLRSVCFLPSFLPLLLLMSSPTLNLSLVLFNMFLIVQKIKSKNKTSNESVRLSTCSDLCGPLVLIEYFKNNLQIFSSFLKGSVILLKQLLTVVFHKQ